MDVDVIVLGMGPGGEDVAGRLAEAGLRVAAVESNLVGGECPYWGCIPSKIMIHEAETSREWPALVRRVREATDSWDDKVAADRFTGKGGHLVRGHGRVTGPGEVTVGDQVLRAARGIVIATGSQAAVPPIEGLAGTPYWTNHEAIENAELPESIIVLGGGAIGVELAQMFRAFGVAVTVVEAADRLIALEEPEAGALLEKVFTGRGIDVRTSAKVARVDYADGRFSLAGAEAERLLVATGRRVDLKALGVGAIGLDESARAIPVDARMRAAEGVWAIGDAVGKGAFTHMSMYQANIVVKEILGEPVHEAEYHAVPRVTFTDPEVGAVGPTEAQARERGLDVRIAVGDLGTRGYIAQAEGLVKLVAADGVLVGATVAAPPGGEVLGLLTLAVHARVPLTRLDEMIYAYPTFHRAVSAAVKELTAAG
ncbi:dihydrolipoyl dehydrogenase family protein [Nonomuraea endophytica]|uniref:Pyruvate/2-oxoglutarate dehydrogenase complex dihydrolipoamide dehydrogenase (E3) component n=1 Tax=Nonomuraea endophytica TaxID=714136 RepID=A0A7W8AH66_9ACTN|nr:NAD(P)/FAD-dependent oxidoreductase [Nonomuraea endophytica]MBB5085026.1 pyruvate/2-oxoglutarate dehydrogenase complex dihydrolipoamide dehydrogenase (E3) component [Nonomuraea endophytica]